MKNTDSLNPQESLDIISKTIYQTRENTKSNSFYFLLWGWILALASFGNYYLATYTTDPHPYKTWYILIPIGWIWSILYSIKDKKTQGYETYLDFYMGNLWMTLGVAFIISVFISVKSGISPTSLTLLLAGVGTLISGLSMKSKPFIVGGILFFLFSISTLFVSDNQKLLINGIAIILGYIIPAYILKYSKS